MLILSLSSPAAPSTPTLTTTHHRPFTLPAMVPSREQPKPEALAKAQKALRMRIEDGGGSEPTGVVLGRS